MYASSIEKAQQIAQQHPLLAAPGVPTGKRTYLPLHAHIRQSLCQCTSGDWPEEVTAAQFRSIFMPSHGHRGLLYRTGEYALVRQNDRSTQSVVRITNVLVVQSRNVYFNFVQGEKYSLLRKDSGDVDLHPFSDSVKVVPSTNSIVVPTTDLLRKVMLYPEPENLEDPSHYIVIDYLRQEVPLSSRDVLVPFYPEVDDMVLVRGDVGEEPWLGHIQSVDVTNKTCQLHFYIETYHGSKRYRLERAGHHRTLERVQWASIVGSASGNWSGREWTQNC